MFTRQRLQREVNKREAIEQELARLTRELEAARRAPAQTNARSSSYVDLKN